MPNKNSGHPAHIRYSFMNNLNNERKKTVMVSIGGEEEQPPVVQITRCLRCGYPIRPGVMECPNCGYDVGALQRQNAEQAAAQQLENERKHKATRMVAVADIPTVTLKPAIGEDTQPVATLHDGDIVRIGDQLLEIHFEKE